MTDQILQIRSNGQITLSAEVRRKAHLKEGDLLNVEIQRDGSINLKPKIVVDRDQAYFWSERWQTGEKQVEQDIQDGRTREFSNIKDMLDDLEF